MVSNMGPPNQLPLVPMQFRPMGPIPPPPPPVPPFPPVNSQQYQPGGHSNVGMQLPPPPPIQYHPAMQPPFQHPLRPPPQAPPQGHVHSQGIAAPPPDMQHNRPMMPGSAPPPVYNNMMPNSGGPRFSHMHQVKMTPTTIQAEAPNFPMGQTWYPTANQQMQIVLPAQHVAEQQKGEQEGLLDATQSIKPNTSSLSNGDQNSGQKKDGFSVSQSDLSDTQPQPAGEHNSDSKDQVKGFLANEAKMDSSYWKEYISPGGKKYYYNKRTRISSWEKPLELMTPTERADSSTEWREVTTTDGRRFYFNKVTKKSTWSIPDEIKLARECANLAVYEDKSANPAYVAFHVSGTESSDAGGNNLSSTEREMVPSQRPGSSADQQPAAVPESSVIQETITGAISQIDEPSNEKTLEKGLQEASKDAGTLETGDGIIPDGKTVDREPHVYESKEDAKIAFRSLLETANIGSDWTWDQAMRVIINDRRYGALRSLGERKQAYNEFLGHMKKMETEEKRVRQRRAKEDFKNMLQECKDVTSSTRWSKAVSILEKDERFQAVERTKDREDLFEAHIEDLKKKERAKAMEDHKRHVAEYIDFLKSCDFIKASSQWRKFQHRLEADERCSRLEKIARLEIFQEYVQDLEMEEEEQRKIRIEELRRSERRNRDEFRKLMEEHSTVGLLTINSHWRDYATKVKETPAYISISSNTSGPTAKDLFDDVIEDLERQYLDDKERVEEAIMNQKISLGPNWSLENFKSALSEESYIKRISDANMKLIFNELLEFKRERDGKEAKRRKRHADDIYDYLINLSDLTSSSKWDDYRTVVEDRFTGEESFFRDIFDTVIEKLKEKEKHKEKRRKEGKKQERRFKEHRKERERRKDGHRNDSEGSKSSSVEEKKRSRDRSKRYERQDDDSTGYMSLDDLEKNQSRSYRHNGDTTKLKQDKQMEAESESESKRQRREQWEDLQNMDGAEEGEIRT